MRLCLIAGKVTDSVTFGFLPAAADLGLDTVLLTDRPDDHRAAGYRVPVTIVPCDVTDYRAIVAQMGAPDAVFSNSDHLQAAAALAAAYRGLPGKDWRAALRTKNKALMRSHLAECGLDTVVSRSADDPCPPLPGVLKPREGVASEDVFLVTGAAELATRTAAIRSRRSDPLVVEEYLPGELRTLETLGDAGGPHVVGAFRTALSPPPYFVEQRMDWAPPPPEAGQVLAQLDALGVGLGACHTEFVVHEGRARLIEVNYRAVGDHADFLLAELLDYPLFHQILRLHLGDPLTLPAPTDRHGTVDYLLPDRPGTLQAAPPAGRCTQDGVTLDLHPHRAVGDTVTITHTNRDFLGTLLAVGPTAPAVHAALARFRATRAWTIR